MDPIVAIFLVMDVQMDVTVNIILSVPLTPLILDMLLLSYLSLSIPKRLNPLGPITLLDKLICPPHGPPLMCPNAPHIFWWLELSMH